MLIWRIDTVEHPSSGIGNSTGREIDGILAFRQARNIQYQHSLLLASIRFVVRSSFITTFLMTTQIQSQGWKESQADGELGLLSAGINARLDISNANSLYPEDQLPSTDTGLNLAQTLCEIRNRRVMIIDDEELVIRVVRRFLSADGYSQFVTLTDPREAWDKIESEQPDVVLLDINMPHITGLELLEKRKREQKFELIPFIVLSANSETETKREALIRGATDFLSKPVDSSELVLRVQNALTIKRHYDHLNNYAQELAEQVRERTRMLERSCEQVIHCLARAAEFRDNETGEHVIRVGKYSAVIAEQLGFSAEYCHRIELAAQLHDVGKIGIPDAILLNPNKLSSEEFEIMKTHCALGTSIMQPLAQEECESIRQHVLMGASIIDGTDSPIVQLAVEITKSHHEKWDGTGYPNRLKGEAIPISGRIVCVADVFDALLSERPYKPKFSLKRCLEIMISERGTRFDPKVLDAFLNRLADIERIRRNFRDAAKTNSLL